jgi:hypothetical protein
MLLLYDCYYFTICCYQHFTCIMPSPMPTLSQLTMPSLSTLHVWPHLYPSPTSCGVAPSYLLSTFLHHVAITNNNLLYSIWVVIAYWLTSCLQQWNVLFYIFKSFFFKSLFLLFVCVCVFLFLFLCLCKLCEWLWICVLCTYVCVIVCLYVYARFFLQDFLRIIFST